MNGQPTFGVVLPVYNRHWIVREALDTIVRQTRPPGLVVVVDDGSRDGTADRIRAWQHEMRPPFELKLIEQANAGCAAARNRGLREAKDCDWVALLDSDDLWPEEHIAGIEKRVAAAPEALAASRDTAIRKVTEAIERVVPTAEIDALGGPAFMFHRGVPMPSATALRPREFLNAGGFDEQWPYAEDIEAFFRFSLYGRWVHVPGDPSVCRKSFPGKGAEEHNSSVVDTLAGWRKRTEMRDRWIRELGGADRLAERHWRSRLADDWCRLGRRYRKAGFGGEAKWCFGRAIGTSRGCVRAYAEWVRVAGCASKKPGD